MSNPYCDLSNNHKILNIFFLPLGFYFFKNLYKSFLYNENIINLIFFYQSI